MDIIQKTREDYNKIAHHFSGTRYDIWPELKQFKKYIKDNQNILDWGCGNGRLLLMLQDKKIKYFGVDQSKELIKIARSKRKEDLKNKKAKFFITAKKQKKFANNFFDLVFMIASFHHLPDENSQLGLLNKTYSEMKPGGKLIITVWNLESDWAKNKKYKKIDKNNYSVPFKNNKGELEAERIYHAFSVPELKNLFKKTKFKIKKIGYHDKETWSDEKQGGNIFVIAEK